MGNGSDLRGAKACIADAEAKLTNARQLAADSAEILRNSKQSFADAGGPLADRTVELLEKVASNFDSIEQLVNEVIQ